MQLLWTDLGLRGGLGLGDILSFASQTEIEKTYRVSLIYASIDLLQVAVRFV